MCFLFSKLHNLALKLLHCVFIKGSEKLQAEVLTPNLNNVQTLGTLWYRQFQHHTSH